MKNFFIVLGVLLVAALVWFGYSALNKSDTDTYQPPEVTPVPNDEVQQPSGDTTTDEFPEIDEAKPTTVIGSSVEDRDITAYHYGSGEREVLFVGGMHGGYSWNTALVAYELMDYLKENPSAIPEGVRVTVIPVLNPDGLYKVVGKTEGFTKADVPAGTNEAGRFNANNVDLNRNFDCDWKSSGTWQSKTVSGGNKVFSEPESQALRDYVENRDPAAVVVWYSAAGGVYSSSCGNGILPETKTLTNLYAQASGYRAYDSFDNYQITGDAVNWLARNGVPAISVLLTNHSDTEWSKNQKGIDALLKYYQE